MNPALFFGEALTDRFYDEKGILRKSTPGGAPLNAAVGAARLQIPTAFAGGIGGDGEAREILKVMDLEGIGRRFAVIKKQLPTAAAEVRLNERREPAFRFLRSGTADALIESEDFSSLRPQDYSCLHCGGVMLASEPGASVQEALAERFYDAAIPVSFDPNIRPALIGDEEAYRERVLMAMARPQLVKLSLDDISWLFPGQDVNDAFSQLHCLRRGAMTALTLGAQGSLLASGQVCHRQWAYSVAAIDTTGCGDGFTAGLLRGLLTLDGCAWDELTEEQLRWVAEGASAVAARVCEKEGALPAMPYLADVYAL